MLSWLRSFAVSSTFATSFSASAAFLWKSASASFLISATSSARISGEPSFVFAWPSKVGSCMRIATAPMMPSRTSSPSNFFFAYSLRAFVRPSLNAERCVPPSVVCCPFTKE